MTTFNDTVHFQAERHPLVFSGEYSSLTDYCLHLMHVRSYEEASSLATAKSVLDIGCNNGYGTAVLKGACNPVCGIDVSPAAIKDAQRRFGDRGIDFRVYDGRKIPFHENSFDALVSFQVIEHIDDTASYLREIARVLRPSGMALFTTPNAAIRLDPGMTPWNEFHVREYRAHELATVLKTVFNEVSIRGLFASEDLYRIEYERCQEALRSARSRQSPRRTCVAKQLRHKAAAFIRSAFPAQMIEQIKARHSVRAVAGARPRAVDSAVFQRYSTRDLFYREDNVDEALDLLAMCTRSR